MDERIAAARIEGRIDLLREQRADINAALNAVQEELEIARANAESEHDYHVYAWTRRVVKKERLIAEIDSQIRKLTERS